MYGHGEKVQKQGSSERTEILSHTLSSGKCHLSSRVLFLISLSRGIGGVLTPTMELGRESNRTLVRRPLLRTAEVTDDDP